MYTQSSRPQTISCRFISRLVLFSEQLLGLSQVPVNDISLESCIRFHLYHYHFSPRASCLEHLIKCFSSNFQNSTGSHLWSKFPLHLKPHPGLIVQICLWNNTLVLVLLLLDHFFAFLFLVTRLFFILTRAGLTRVAARVRSRTTVLLFDGRNFSRF